MAGRRKGVRKVKMSAESEGDPHASVLALHALVFPLSLPLGRLPHRLHFARLI